jgi:hypothetical protein
MIINKEEIEKAAKEYVRNRFSLKDSFKYGDFCIQGFLAGEKLAEDKFNEFFMDVICENQGLKLYKDNEAERFKELAVEFGEYLQGYEDSIYNISIIYNEFLK